MERNETPITTFSRIIVLSLYHQREKTMKHIINRYFLLFLICIICSCNGNKDFANKMHDIKRVGDSNPELARKMLDSLNIEVRSADEYTQMKFDLLSLRINDKAYIIPTSDILSKRVTAYFSQHGTDAEKQEAYYYNGSVYRDLQDTPRAIENFLKSIEITEESKECDSILLRNAYSNLNSLYYKVQDYRDCLVSAKKGYELSKKLSKMNLTSIMQLGMSYIYLDSTVEAKKAFCEAFDYILTHNDYEENDAYTVLAYLAILGETTKANNCMEFIHKRHFQVKDASDYLSLATYFQKNNETDSAIAYYNKVIEKPTGIENIYDASKFLFKLYDSLNNSPEAIKYARLYVKATDSLDLGKRQEVAATANNQFKNHYDKHKEEVAKEKQMRDHYMSIIFLVLAILTAVSAIAIHIYLRNKNLSKTLALTKELDNINKELEGSKKKLKESEDALSEKLEQNETFVRLLHKTEFEMNAEEVINNIQQSANGSKKMSTSEWRKLYQAVDEQYPDFKKLIVQKLDSLTEQQIQLCYLMRIGLTKPQIQNITNIPHVTVWRWTKKFSWASGATGSL